MSNSGGVAERGVLEEAFRYVQDKAFDFESAYRDVPAWKWGVGAGAATFAGGIFFAEGVGVGLYALGARGVAATGAAIGWLSTRGAELANVLSNRSYGNMWREVVANGLRELVPEGWLVTTEEYFATPLGKRFLDVVVWNEWGELVGGVETKAGASPYITQLLKDEWLMLRYNFPIFEYRYPFSNTPWFR